MVLSLRRMLHGAESCFSGLLNGDVSVRTAYGAWRTLYEMGCRACPKSILSVSVFGSLGNQRVQGLTIELVIGTVTEE